jgi:hypothetical protein
MPPGSMLSEVWLKVNWCLLNTTLPLLPENLPCHQQFHWLLSPACCDNSQHWAHKPAVGVTTAARRLQDLAPSPEVSVFRGLFGGFAALKKITIASET